jgi:hypothetical protein
MLTWTLHEDKEGLTATGNTRRYWLGETSRLRVQGPERNKPMALLVMPNGDEQFSFYGCYNYLSDAVHAAEVVEVAWEERGDEHSGGSSRIR